MDAVQTIIAPKFCKDMKSNAWIRSTLYLCVRLINSATIAIACSAKSISALPAHKKAALTQAVITLPTLLLNYTKRRDRLMSCWQAGKRKGWRTC